MSSYDSYGEEKIVIVTMIQWFISFTMKDTNTKGLYHYGWSILNSNLVKSWTQGHV